MKSKKGIAGASQAPTNSSDITINNTTSKFINVLVDGVYGNPDYLDHAPLCVQVSQGFIGEDVRKFTACELKVLWMDGDITKAWFNFMTEDISLYEQLKRKYISRDLYDEIVAVEWDKYEEVEQDIVLGLAERDDTTSADNVATGGGDVDV